MSELTKIFHVEDDADLLEIAKMSLELIGGFEIEQADCGPTALEKVEAFAPHMMLLDIQMNGMTGPETLKEIRKLPGYESIPAIFLTAKFLDSLDGTLEGPMNLGVIPKPFDPLTLSDEIRAMWDAKF